MRLRKKHWARPELEASDIVIYQSFSMKIPVKFLFLL